MTITNVTALERKKLLESELTRFVGILSQQQNTQRIYLFGSLAAGQIHSWSDLDVVIIQQTAQPFYQRLRAIRKLLQPKVGTDILVYTPEEFERLQTERPFFRQEVLNKSIVVYERKR